MQKMITVTIDTKMLADRSHETFTIQEVDAVNELLESGWYMEEWEFLTEDADEDGKISLIAVLNDDQVMGLEEDFSYEDYNTDEEEDDSDEHNEDELKEEDKEEK